jgi:regulatory protein SWI5
MTLFGMTPQNTMGMEQMMSFPPDTFSFTPPASPGYSTGNKPSPIYRELTPADLGDIPDLHHSEVSQMLPDLPVMGQSLQVMGAVNGYSAHSLPSLSHSGSSPAAEMVAFDFSDLPGNSSTMSSQSMQLPMKLESERNEFDTFLDYGGMEMSLDSSTQDFFSL